MRNSYEKIPVTIVGAGFSGLVSAFFLAESGHAVVIHEQSDRVGGLIQTHSFPWGIIETAANGILTSIEFETMCKKIGVSLVAAQPDGKARYIYRRGKPRRWPLTVWETLVLLSRLPFFKLNPPLAKESVSSWARRALGEGATKGLVTPALQGIYAGDSGQMNAQLIFGRFFQPKVARRKSHFSGTVAPEGGMNALLLALQSHLKSRGVVIHMNSRPMLSQLSRPVLVATSLPAARKFLSQTKEINQPLYSKVAMLPVASLSLAFPKTAKKITGFGCLFARDEGVRSLGVIFEESIFGNRSSHHLERWILGGALDQEVTALSDEEILEIVLKDRAKAFSDSTPPLSFHLKKWNEALPHYTEDLMNALHSNDSALLESSGIFLAGNYRGKIGLTGIFEKARLFPGILESAFKWEEDQ